MQSAMRNNYFFLVSLLIFNSALAFELPEDLYKPIILHALNKNLDFVAIVKRVSRKFYKIINKPDVLKIIVAQNVGPLRTHSMCARHINTAKSLLYLDLNKWIMEMDSIESYVSNLAEPLMDINCQLLLGARYVNKLAEIMRQEDMTIKKKVSWITTLLDHGADPHLVFYEDWGREKPYTTWTVFGRACHAAIESKPYWNGTNPSDVLEVFLKHNAEAKEPYIGAKHLQIDAALKEKRKDDRYGKPPFMTWPVDYLKLISKYGFDIKTVYPHPLHFHLHDNPDPAPVMVAYLVHEQKCDPYELVDGGDGSEPESPYTIVTKLPDTHTAKQELLEIFKSAQKH